MHGAALQHYASLGGASMGTTWSARFLAPFCQDLPHEAQHGGQTTHASRESTSSPRNTQHAAGPGVKAGMPFVASDMAPDASSALLARLQHSIQMALGEIVTQMSTWDPESEISRLNRAEPGWYQVSPDFFKVLTHALELAQATQGAYDPTAGALVNLWGFGPAGAISAPPTEQAIHNALALGGWQRTALNTEHRGVWQPGGLQFDLSSIAKGYGVDQMAQVLEQAGVEHYLVELGGELKARGLNPEGKPWSLDIESPSLGQEKLPVALNNAAIATSGHYRRYFTHGNRRYAHTVNPQTGWPLPDNLVSVSVIHPQCMMADGLATALLALGPEHGPAYARRHGVAALFMTRHPNDFAVDWTETFTQLASAQAAPS